MEHLLKYLQRQNGVAADRFFEVFCEAYLFLAMLWAEHERTKRRTWKREDIKVYLNDKFKQLIIL